MTNWILRKTDSRMYFYFKCKDRTGHINTSHIPDAMKFNSKNEAIDYNHKWLYGDYEAVKTTSSQPEH